MDSKLILELVGLFLTLMVLIYLIVGDNALFRIVTYTFVGIASGYVTILIIFQVLLPRLFNMLRTGSLPLIALGLVPFVLGLLLLFKLSSRFSTLGTLSMATLAGIGAAVAVGGALFGTLFGQIRGTINLFNLEGGGGLARLLEAVLVLLGAISTLAYFQFGARRRPAAAAEPLAAEAASESSPSALARRPSSLEVLAKIGQVFIGITLGAMFAGVYTAAITALIERLGFVIDTVNTVLGRPF